MRVVHLCSSGRFGGVETSVLTMLGSLRASVPSWTIAVIAPEESSFLERVRQLGYEAVALPFPAPLARFGEAGARRAGAEQVRAAVAAVAYARLLRRTVTRLAPDVVHAHGIKMLVLSRWASPARSRVVWHLHDYVAGREASGRALRASCGRCAAVIANSRSVAEDFRANISDQLPISVIYNAVDTERFSPEGHRIDLDALSGLPPAAPGAVRIGLPATFARWKGQDVFLRALGRLSPDTAWRAYIIGGAAYQTRGSQWTRDGLETIVRELGLGARVGFTGLVDDMPGVLRSLDVVVHASTQPEPFGMTIVEALSCGRATVVALAGGAAEIVRDEVNTAGYPPGDDISLAQVLSSLIADPARRACLGAEGRRAATAGFDATRLGPELRRVYEPVLAAN